ncbi:MAG: hypothetical protein QOC98_2072, partial [Frankiaceae bacterium]|nr:hypothetical protein [Frankiaceae bacterium]
MTLLDAVSAAAPDTHASGRPTNRPCPACRGSRADLVHELALQAPDGHPLGDGYDVVACRSCGTGFADVAASLDYY